MKLLLDENLSPALARQLAADYPDTRHVDHVGLHGETDERLWSFAAENGFVLVSKDADFRELCTARGPPPKVVWLSVGNVATHVIRELLIANREKLEAFGEDREEALLVLAGIDDGWS